MPDQFQGFTVNKNNLLQHLLKVSKDYLQQAYDLLFRQNNDVLSTWTFVKVSVLQDLSTRRSR